MKDKWIKVVERKGQSILISSYFYNGIQTKYFKKILELPYGLDHYLIIKFANYYLEREVERFHKLIKPLVSRDPSGFVPGMIKKLCQKADELLEFSRIIKNTKINDKNVLGSFSKFSKLCLEFGPAMYFPILIEPEIEVTAMKAIGQHIKKDIFHLFNELTVTAEPTAGSFELRSLYEIAYQKYKKADPILVNRLLETHLKKYGWLSFTKFVGRP